MTARSPISSHSPAHSSHNASAMTPRCSSEQPPTAPQVALEELGQGAKALDLLDMPADVKDIYLRLVRQPPGTAEPSVSKSELRVLRIYTKKRFVSNSHTVAALTSHTNRLKEAKKEAKRRKKDRERAARKGASGAQGNGQRRASGVDASAPSFDCATPVSSEETAARARYSHNATSPPRTRQHTEGRLGGGGVPRELLRRWRVRDANESRSGGAGKTGTQRRALRTGRAEVRASGGAGAPRRAAARGGCRPVADGGLLASRASPASPFRKTCVSRSTTKSTPRRSRRRRRGCAGSRATSKGAHAGSSPGSTSSRS